MPTGYITFPGIADPKHMHATRTLGTRPDAAVLYARPQSGSPDTSGASTLSFGFNGTVINWTNALCDRGTFAVSTTGHYQVFTILDKRWRWSKSYWTHAYNVRYPDGSIDTSSVATLQQIVIDLLTEIGESVYDVSGVSSGEYPEIVFDHDDCASALEELLNPRGYVVSLNIDDSVTVWRRGSGTTLPAGSELVNASISIDPPEIPYYLTALGRKTLVQSKLLMQAVGLDTDGAVKPVASLSYAPSGGWGSVNKSSMDFISDSKSKELALQTVGKWYQVVSQADSTYNITGYCPTVVSVSSAWQYLPLDDKILDNAVDVFSKQHRADAYVEGTFYLDDVTKNPPAGSNTAAFTRVDRREWRLDKELGVVMFEQLALKKSSSNLVFADVYFTCSYSIHDTTSFTKDRYYRSLVMGGYGIDMREIDELQRQIVVRYTPGTSTVSSVVDNVSTMDGLADEYLDTAVNSYFTAVGTFLMWRGVAQVNTDGAALQVKWDVAVPDQPIPFCTMVSQYCEGIPLLPTRHERDVVRRSKLEADPMTRRKKNYRRTMSRVREDGKD